MPGVLPTANWMDGVFLERHWKCWDHDFQHCQPVRHSMACKAVPRGQSAAGCAATPCGVKAAIQDGWGAPGMKDEGRQDGHGCELFGMQGTENIASGLTNKKKPSCFAKAHCKHLWVMEFPNGGRNVSLLEQLLGGGCRGCTEKLGCSGLQGQGVMDLQGSPSKKKEGEARVDVKSS